MEFILNLQEFWDDIEKVFMKHGLKSLTVLNDNAKIEIVDGGIEKEYLNLKFE